MLSCDANPRQKYRRDISRRNDAQNAFSTLLQTVVSKRKSCRLLGVKCTKKSDCCGAGDRCVICQRRFLGLFGSHVCDLNRVRDSDKGSVFCPKRFHYGVYHEPPSCGGDGHRCGRK